jgi:hypothetical protein
MLFATAVRGQEVPAAKSVRELAKEALNPFAESYKVPVESVTGFRIGPRRNTGESVNIEPALPFEVSPDWDVIVQPLLAATALPSPGATTGFDDMQLSVFLTPRRTRSWIWGLGPIMEFPTASNREVGTGKWSGGPTGAVIYSKGPWLNGLLVSHLASFPGNRHRGDVNLTSIEPLVSYSFHSGWSVQCNPTISYDWTAHSPNSWTLPLGADVGRTIVVGSQALSVQIGAYDLVRHPDGDPASIVRVQVTLLFPSGE